jgi:hypothetical protein
MADVIPTHYSTQFSSNWISRIQQGKCRLDAFIEYDDFMGERKRYDRMSSQSAQQRTERKGPTRITDTTSDSRWAYRKSFDIANLLDADDAKNLAPLVLPTSQYVMDHAKAYNRNIDDQAWQSASGVVITGELGTTETAFPVAQAIAEGGTGLTLAKLLSAREILEEADADDDAPDVLCVTAQQLTNLLNTTQITSADYNTVKALVAGQVDTFMGFKFVKIQRLTKVGNTRTCVGWRKGAIKIMRGAKESKISIRGDLSDSTQIRSTWHLSGVRLHDELVFTIDCLES